MALATEVILVNQAGTPLQSPPAPLVATYAGIFDTATSPKTVSVTSAVGDLMISFSMAEDDTSTIGISGHSLTWTQQINQGNTTQGRIVVNSATETAAGTWTATATNTGTAGTYGFDIARFSGVTIGAKFSDYFSSQSSMALSLTTTVANSAILVLALDWSAINGYSRLWNSIGGPTPNSMNVDKLELLYQVVSGHYTVYAGYYPDAGAVGAKALGITFPGAPGPGGHTVVAIELVPAGGGAAPAIAAPRPKLIGVQAAAQRSANW